MVTVEDGILRLAMAPDWVDAARHGDALWFKESLIGAPRPICGEVTYTPNQFLYGSFRASIKTSDQAGGVVGWFLYKDGVPGDGNLRD